MNPCADYGLSGARSAPGSNGNWSIQLEWLRAKLCDRLEATIREHDESVNRSLLLRGRAMELEQLILSLSPGGTGMGVPMEENAPEEGTQE